MYHPKYMIPFLGEPEYPVEPGETVTLDALSQIGLRVVGCVVSAGHWRVTIKADREKTASYRWFDTSPMVGAPDLDETITRINFIWGANRPPFDAHAGERIEATVCNLGDKPQFLRLALEGDRIARGPLLKEDS